MRGNKKKVIRNKIELFARPSEQQHYANVLFLPSNHHHLCMGETKKKPKKNPDTAKNLNWIFLQQLGFDCTLFSLKLWVLEIRYLGYLNHAQITTDLNSVLHCVEKNELEV